MKHFKRLCRWRLEKVEVIQTFRVLVPDRLWFLAGWWKIRTLEQPAKTNYSGTPCSSFFNSHLRKKIKLAFSTVYAVLWNQVEKILFYFKSVVWRLKISASSFTVEVWLDPPQQNLKQPRFYARRNNTLPYPSFFFSFLPYVQQLVLSALYFLHWETTFNPKGPPNGRLRLWMFGLLQHRRKSKENFSSSCEGCVWLTSYWTTIWKVLNSPDNFGH